VKSRKKGPERDKCLIMDYRGGGSFYLAEMSRKNSGGKTTQQIESERILSMNGRRKGCEYVTCGEVVERVRLSFSWWYGGSKVGTMTSFFLRKEGKDAHALEGEK